ncbi:alpha/beta fold hydrolase [Micromonospora sp. LAH09]|uniref:alpha/beta fold hydrolase n=1 Tax=Micromonospora cabrerizensis TaxID=2911213 RepID=UPI001EE8C4E5|nr:alpha/beta hydrolase [Micromonospora cabrerizensis]MCG5472512.1 alpha/beta fold hydrolase [Micromonospora cabrerizensis]
MGEAATTGTVRSADGTTIAYERSGTGPAVILVDAAGGFREMGPMRSLAAQLAEEFTVLTYDRRGRGQSTDTVPYAPQREVEDLRALIDDVAGASAALYGFSSGAVLALLAAASGLPVTRLAVLEPPFEQGERSPDEPDLAADITELVAAGRRGDAVLHFQRSIGVPAEFVDAMRDGPGWPAMEALAHTLVYDLTLLTALPAEALTTLTIPTLVLNSAQSDARLRGWAQGVAEKLPAGRHRTLPGEWHGVSDEVLAPVLADHFSGRAD